MIFCPSILNYYRFVKELSLLFVADRSISFSLPQALKKAMIDIYAGHTVLCFCNAAMLSYVFVCQFFSAALNFVQVYTPITRSICCFFSLQVCSIKLILNELSSIKYFH